MGSPESGTIRPARWHTLATAGIALALLGTGCQTARSFKDRQANFAKLFSSQYDDPKAEEKLAKAEQLFLEKKYPEARAIFKELADNTGNSAQLAEHARYMQAECRRFEGTYPEAVDTYNRLLKDFPTGVHRQEACARMFEIADYWLDDFRGEVENRKPNKKGIIGWRPGMPDVTDKTRPWIDQEGRALQALEHVHTQDPVGPLADKSLFWCGYVNYVRGNYMESDTFFSQLIDMHKDSPLRPQAIAYAIKAKNLSTGGASYDGKKCAQALQLITMAEASVPELTRDPKMANQLMEAKVAIRAQQAEKDLETAEYYERVGYPGSAIFCYELVRRRYGGTPYSDEATERKDQLMADIKSGKRLVNKYDPIDILHAKWEDMLGKKPEYADPDTPPPPSRGPVAQPGPGPGGPPRGGVQPAGGVPTVPGPNGW
jgi:outer membrane protein assembly factor BamD (BamD/ComL family)